MAGIAAIINTNHAPIREGVRPLHGFTHVKVIGEAGVGAAPLSREAEAQPLACLHDHLTVVVCGRLDDRRTLSATLDVPTHPYVSDAALILRAYEKWGDDCVLHLLGDFAFCLWDDRRKRLLCARDHFGVKPLYYARVGELLIVSSVLSWIRTHPSVSSKLRDEAIGDFFLFGVHQEPSRTTFADISRLPPAHRITYDSATGAIRITQYWSLDARDPVRYANPLDYVDRFSELLRVAIEDRLRGARAGVLMSGGVDSSSIATVAADVLGPEARDRLRAFTFVYETWGSDDERRFASLVATSLGIEASQVPVDRYAPFDRWDSDGLPAEPTLEGLSVVMNDVFDLISAHGNVALTGEGGDPMLLPSSLLSQVGSIPIASLATDVLSACRSRQRPPLGIRSWIERRFARPQLTPDWLGSDLLSVFDADARLREIDARRAISHGARQRAVTDVIDPWWTSTFESLDPGVTRRPVELRYPFFDVRLASFLLRLPSFPWCLNKHVLRTAMKGRLPESVRIRPKTPLASSPVAPGAQWSASRALDLFSSTPAIERFVNVRRFCETVRGESLLAGESYAAWAAISLAMWLRHDSVSVAPVGAL
jgi:asparagine synthase (glutamine-hydrolysing)